MASLPRLWEQDPGKAAAGYGTKKFPAVLPEVQKGGIGQCKGIYDNKDNRARRKDAEPMIRKGRMALRFWSLKKEEHMPNHASNYKKGKIHECAVRKPANNVRLINKAANRYLEE